MEALALPPEDEPSGDQLVYLHNMTWKDYERLLARRGESSVPRITYVEGTIELMRPSLDHGHVATTIGRLLEAWALRRRLRLNGYGSWTLKRKKGERGLEPDKCYVLGAERKRVPDLAIEVVWTPGGIEKREIYRRLGVGELWTWEQGRIEVCVLEAGQYLPAIRSRLLPELDLEALARFATVADQLEAVEGFLAETHGAGS